ncbi:HesA/MoeB/ThiF family protein [Woodsholea maritima]|uniref:HesA/MoeB/ThiF family protein n=1 Tax=Woodsholea maritima TaxID=240237 RepID=UPI000381BA0B|nr:HesA/MoeB/ThiF family protein [Woodsholea maritima]
MSIDIERHARHILLKEIGGPGQNKLARAHIALIGVGGLGAPAALYLAAAGVGKLTLIDPDYVSLDNLQRQILYTTKDIGAPKAQRAKDRLTALDPRLHCDIHAVKADAQNLPALLQGVDVVLDGCDDFETRFAVNHAAIAAQIPLISGALGRWDAQASVFAGHESETACYQCFVPDIPPEAETCERVGVVGPLTGICGSLMALEAIKLITGAGQVLKNRLWIYEGLTARTRIVTLAKDPACPSCGTL